MTRFIKLPFLIVAIFASLASSVESADPDPERFAESMEEFAAWDSKNSFPDDAILLVGSSSVRFWATADAFPDKPIINRGFGGSELSDVIYHFDTVILPYSPRQIFLYAGDNDIGNGKTADRVFADYKQLVEMVRSSFPDTEVVFISIKPSMARWEQWPEMVEANRLVREYSGQHPDLGYADLATPLLDDNGQPKDVYEDDGLHLNGKGYELWQEALAPYVE